MNDVENAAKDAQILYTAHGGAKDTDMFRILYAIYGGAKDAPYIGYYTLHSMCCISVELRKLCIQVLKTRPIHKC